MQLIPVVEVHTAAGVLVSCVFLTTKGSLTTSRTLSGGQIRCRLILTAFYLPWEKNQI